MLLSIDVCTDKFIQRASSSTAGAESSPFYLTLTASVATAATIGSAAYLYGQEAFAMTPAEEG